MKIKQSFCYPCFRDEDTSLHELCRVAAEIGYAGVELWFRGDEFDELIDAANEANLAVASMCAHQSLTEGMNNRDDHDRIENEILESIEIANRLKIANLICFSGNRIDGQSDQDAVAAMAECLSRVISKAEAANINLNIELLNSKIDHFGYLCDHTAIGVEVCKAVAGKCAKLLYDIYHMQIMEGDIIRTIKDNIQYLGHFHTAGNPGRRDMDGEQELNYPAICNAIAESGFDGYVAHEFTPKGDRIKGLRSAFELCDI